MSAVHAHILVAVLNVVCVKRRPLWWWWWGVCACVLGGGGTAGVVEGKQECGVNSLPMHNSDYRVYGIGSAAHRPSRNSLGQTVAPFELHAVAPHRCGSAGRSSQRPLASLAALCLQTRLARRTLEVNLAQAHRRQRCALSSQHLLEFVAEPSVPERAL